MKLLIALALSIPLSGCFFFMIPGQMIGDVSDSLSGNFGNYCIDANTAVGGKVRTPGGGSATVDKISGPSGRCKDPTPIRAAVTFDQ